MEVPSAWQRVLLITLLFNFDSEIEPGTLIIAAKTLM